MRVIVDKDMCLGCGICAGLCPDVFELGTQPYCVVQMNPVAAGYRQQILDAIEQCPEEAISLPEE